MSMGFSRVTSRIRSTPLRAKSIPRRSNLGKPSSGTEKKAAVDWARRRQRDQRGTATLEFIVLLPLLLFVWFGILELSRAWHTRNIVTTTAEARIDGILAAANLGVTDNGDGTYTLTGATRTVTCIPPETDPPETDCVPDSEVRADVTVTFDTAVPLLLPILQSLTTIHQSASMRYE